jgi:lambda family phage tail tape measure protein
MANNVGRLGVVLGIETADFVTGIEKAKGTLDKFASSAMAVGKTAALALAAASVASLKYANDIYEVAKANEVAIDTIVKMKMALGQSGGEAENATKIMSSFASYVDKAAGGSFEAQQTFKKLGVSLKDLGTLSMDNLLAKTTEGLGKQTDAITRNAKAVDIFGKSMKGVDVIDFSDGMKSTEAVAKQTADGIREAGKLFDLLDKHAKDTALTFTNALAPAMSKINELLDGYINKNRSFIDTIHDAYNRFLPGMIRERLPQYMRVTPGGQAKRGGGFDVSPDEPKRTITPGEDKDAKRLAQLNAEIQMATVMQGIDRARQEIALQMVYNKESELKDVLLALQYSDDLAKIEEDRAKAIAENHAKDKKIGIAINEKANIERTTAAEKYKAGLAKSESERKLKAYDDEEQAAESLGKWQAKIVFEMEKQVQEQELQMQLSNERLAYENSLYMLTQDQRNILLQQFDLEAKITEYKRQQMLAKENPRDTEVRAQRMRELGQIQIDLNQQTIDQQKTFEYGWTQAYQSYMDNATNAANIGRNVFNSVTQNMSNALDTFVKTGKLNFKSLAQSIIQDLIRIKLQAQATKLFGGDDSGGGIMGMIKSFMGGGSPFVANTTAMAIPSGFAFADGGSPPMGQASLVGERGPELFVPKTAGAIIPNNQLANALGGGGQTVNYNGPYIASMNAIDTQSGTQFLAKNKNTIWAAYQSANRSVPVSR